MSEVKTNKISSLASNNDITLDPDGTGDVVVAQVASSSLDIKGDRTDAQIFLKGGSAGAGIQLFGSTYTNYAGAMYFDATASTTGTNDAQMVFRTGSTPSEAMRIDSSGTVTFTEGDAITVIDRVGTNVAGIKTGSGDDFCVGTADYPQAIRVKNNTGRIGIGEVAPETQLDVYLAAGDVMQVQTGRTNNSNVGMIRFRDGDNNATGQITSNPSTNTTNYVTSSDYRLKENVVNMAGAVDRVKTLSPKRFNFISNADVTVDGFLAHEAQAVVPEAVVGEHNEVDDDGNAVVQGIDLSKLVPLLTGALQEAIARIETLETKVAALEAGE